MDKKSTQKDTTECCINLFKGCSSKAWIEHIKPNLANYVVGLIIVFVSWGLGGASMAATALIAVAASIFAIHNFYTQQRAARIQKIYYEGSLLSVLKHLNDSIDISTKNYSHFITAINFINNDIKNMKELSESTIKMLDNLLLQVKNSSVYLSSEREIFITLFKEKGYKIHQWLFKFDKDIMNFNSFCLEMLAEYRAKLPSSKLVIDTQLKELLNNFYLIQRHMCFAYLIEKIIPIIGEGDFKSSDQMLNYIENSNKITEILERIDEVFKILFGWSKLSDKEFMSYLRNEEGSHYKLFLEKPPRIEECSGPLPISEMKIVSGDILLSNLSITIKGKEQLYSKVQLGIANMTAFDEKPRFYPEAESFQEFD